MKVTKFPQSCAAIEIDDVRLLIDPGSFATDADVGRRAGPIDFVLYTHRHGDHFDQRLVEPLSEAGAAFVCNLDVAPLLEGCDVTVMDDGDRREFGNVAIEAFNLEHCRMVDGSAGPLNTGFLIDDQLFHPGDGTEVPRQTQALMVPIAGPSISFRDAYRMVEDSAAKVVAPMHYDAFIANPEQFARSCDLAEVVVLADGESLTV